MGLKSTLFFFKTFNNSFRQHLLNFLSNSNKIKSFQNNSLYVGSFIEKNSFLKKFFHLKKKIYSNHIFYYKWVGNVYNNFFKNNHDIGNTGGVSFLNTSVVKFIDITSISSYNNLFLRKSKIFNKGRYSRNRQFYRTGVYWCLYLSIILFTGLYYWFYHFIINFGFF